MKCQPKACLATLSGLAVLTLLIFVAPEVARPKDPLDPIYRQQVQSMQRNLSLDEHQAHEILALMKARNDRERHLRRQMATTLTPEQQSQAREIWSTREPGQPLTEQERLALRLRLGVSEAQVQQFQAYRDKIRNDRAATLSEIRLYLYPQQQDSLQKLALEF